MTHLRVACIGAGYFSRFHLNSWARIDGVQLVGACDRDIERAHATGLAAFRDLTTMLGQTKPDLLDIIQPPDAHVETIHEALAAGIKTIICQKPFCQNRDEAGQVTLEAKAVGAQIIVHENFRFQPWYRVIKGALDHDVIGQVHQLTFRLRPGDGQGPHAYLDRQPYFQKMERFLVHETAVHWVDTFRYLLGDPVAIYADLRRGNPVIVGEDAGYIIFDYPNGVRALFDGNRSLDHAADNHRRTMGEALLEGTEGSIDLHGDGSVWLRHFEAMAKTCLLLADGSEGFGGDCVHHLQTHVISALFKGTPLENRAQDYLRVIEIEEAIYASAASGQKLSTVLE